jgi:hypothetical protein
MGKLTDGPHGTMTGRTGNLVGRETKNGNVLSIIPHKSNRPATEDQLQVRCELSTISSFLSSATIIIRTGFKHYAKKMTSMNAAVSYNLKHAIKRNQSGFEIDYPKVVFSRGLLLEPDAPTVTVESGQKVIFSWVPEEEDTAYNSETDLVSIVTYNANQDEFIMAVNKGARGDGLYTMKLPKIFKGDLVHCYISFTSVKGKASNSIYLGNVIVI